MSKEIRLNKAVEGYLIAKAADGFSEHSIEINCWALGRMVDYTGNALLSEIDLNILRGYMNFMRREYKPTRSGGNQSPLAGSSLDRIWSSIRAFYRWAEVDLGIDRPDLRLPRPRYENPVVKPFTQDEIHLLLNAAEYTALVVVPGKNPFRMKRPTADRDTAIILTLLDTGIRASECARLRMSDLDLERGEIVIRPHGSSTKSRPRTVFLGKVARRAVWRYVTSRQTFDDDPLFTSLHGKPMDRNTIRHLLVNAGKRAGVKNVNVHRFRHTCAIQYLRNGGDVFTLQKIMGHATLDMVKKYLDIVTSDAKDAHRSASPADRWQL